MNDSRNAAVPVGKEGYIAAPKAPPRKRTTYAQSSTTGESGTCRAECAGGNRCTCRAEIKHQLHICKDIHCRCHSRKYLDEMARPR
jgi:hypothetical protein